MNHIHVSQLNPKLRQPHLARYKGQLRLALQNPGLSSEQRARIVDMLAQAGGPKNYDPSLPPLPGAIDNRQG